MKIYGVGVFTAPGSSRVIHNFDDGPFDTVNPALIQEARRRGFSFTPPSSPTVGFMRLETDPPVSIDNAITIATRPPKDTIMNKIFKKRGRPAKVNIL